MSGADAGNVDRRRARPGDGPAIDRSASRSHSAADSVRMTAAERSSGIWLSFLSGSRMLGLFLILPVFAVHAATMPGGTDPARIGLALGIYGLTQALLQIPFGNASDRFGRKPVITVGLLLMAAGSFIAATAQTVDGLTVGRALQGAGAVSAAITALLADNTRDSQRSKAMAMVGAMIGLSFGLSLVLAPLLYRQVGLAGLFELTGALALVGIVVLWWRVPDPPSPPVQAGAAAAAVQPPAAASVGQVTAEPVTGFDAARATGSSTAAATAVRGANTSADAGRWRAVLTPDLLRLNAGIFILHLVQMAMFVVVPGLLVSAGGLPLEQHWKLYLPVLVLSFAVVIPLLGHAERRSRVRGLFLGAIASAALSLVGYALLPPSLLVQAALLVAFFIAFNLLEAQLPALLSRLAPAARRGLALGVFNTTLALGLFAGGVLGGLLSRAWGPTAVFLGAAGLLGVWLLVARTHQHWPGRRPAGDPPVI